MEFVIQIPTRKGQGTSVYSICHLEIEQSKNISNSEQRHVIIFKQVIQYYLHVPLLSLSHPYLSSIMSHFQVCPISTFCVASDNADFV